jgi:hypothetical protein
LCLVQPSGQAVAEDSGLAILAGPAGSIEHHQGHHERVVRAGAILGQLELAEEVVDQLDTVPRNLAATT